MSLKAHFSTFRLDLQAAALEFVGTTCFLLLGLGGIQVVSDIANDADAGSTLEQVLYKAISMGFALLISAWLFFRVTGALFNPNISLALLLVGVIRPVRFVLYCVAQMAGAVAAAGLVLALTPGKLASNTSLGPGINTAQGVFIEMFITTALVLAVLMLAAEKHWTTPFAPVGIGLTLFACHIFALYYTGAGMNTARSFGPAAVTGFGYSKHWIYWVGPFLGSVLGATIYTLLKHYHYYELTPDQAATDYRKSPGHPVENVKNIIATGSVNDGGNVDANGESDHISDKPLNGRRVNDSPVYPSYIDRSFTASTMAEYAAALLSSRIPFLLSNAAAFHIATTAPNASPPQSEQEAARIGSFERIHASTIPWLPPLLKRAYTLLMLFECAAIVRSTGPNSAPASLLPSIVPVLDSQVTRFFVIGWLFMTIGACLRLATYRALGILFTYELSIRADHKLVTNGPYNYVRHPSYTAILVIAIGFYTCMLCPGALVGDWIRGMQPGMQKALTVLWISMLASQAVMFAKRAEKEDAMLKSKFGGEWDDWAKRVPAKLVPFIL
ncbi:hypothetical protein HWV62_4037 [Athelia sp. TMB]|nr:hypothetical protein HWV62_4037 [Athelia sp. TMB]